MLYLSQHCTALLWKPTSEILLYMIEKKKIFDRTLGFLYGSIGETSTDHRIVATQNYKAFGCLERCLCPGEESTCAKKGKAPLFVLHKHSSRFISLMPNFTSLSLFHTETSLRTSLCNNVLEINLWCWICLFRPIFTLEIEWHAKLFKDEKSFPPLKQN